MSTKQKFLTKDGYEKLLHELHQLKEEKLPELLKRLKEASDQGDISENAEYDEALAARDLMNARISEIESLLENVEIVDRSSKKGKKSTEVVFGSQVDLEFEDGTNYTVEIVGTGEVEIGDKLRISFESPLGSAIRNKKVGESAKVKLRSGARKQVTIKAIN